MKLRLSKTDKGTRDYSVIGTDSPAFVSVVAALEHKIRVLRLVCITGALTLLAVIGFQQRVILDKLFAKGQEAVVIVPGAPEFTRVRPGQIPPQAVYDFAEYVAGHLGSFSFRDVRYQFSKLEKYMGREVAGKFNRDFESRIKTWESRKLDQSFSMQPVNTFYIRSDERGPLYHAFVKGSRVQYLEGRAFSESPQTLYLSFRTRARFTAEKPFIFEISDLRWMDTQPAEALEAQIKNEKET